MRRFALPLLSVFVLSLMFAVPVVLADGDVYSLSPIHSSSGRANRAPGNPGASPFPDTDVVYHYGATLVCNDCHILHASQSHPYDSANPGLNEAVPYAGGANAKLLKAPDPLDLCLTCHDSHVFAPDVLGGDSNGLTQRSAGAFDDPEVPNPRGHDLGRNLPSGGGFGLCMRCHFSSGADMKVTCIDCHNPHGNGIARNLQWASDPGGTPPLGLFVSSGVTGMARYEKSNVSYGTLNTTSLREVTNICIDCHHVYTGEQYIDGDGDGIHNRHPSYDSERGTPNSIDQGAGDGGSDPVHWMAGTGAGFGTVPRLRFVVSGATDFASATVVDAQSNGVFCLSCHYAHGGDQAFALTWDIPEAGYSAPGCDQCHAISE